MKEEISNIQDAVISLGKKICAPDNLLIVRSVPYSDATPFLLFEDGKFVYSSIERNYQIFRRETSSSDEVLHWIFDEIISTIITESEDFRVIDDVNEGRKKFILERINLMERLNPIWGKMAREESSAELEILDSAIAASKKKSDAASVMEKLHVWLVEKRLLPRCGSGSKR
ncbi:Imm63 family immunity protein [Xanthomonas albilineans]|uniref:Imm63 family immunity protein n=1 Tax=Xanthomonas albilineans TaxID=29447 RepID=UPI0009B99876|nr:Imm63 family immunity protein [Xanthomonas albilineans]